MTVTPAQRLILRSYQSPGDILMLTAAVRDLHIAHPGKFETDVRTSAKAIWDNNPHLTPLTDDDADVQTVVMHYPLIHQSNQRPYHFIHGYIQFLERRLGVAIPVTQFRGDIHLSNEERSSACPFGDQLSPDFWILVAGGKYDYTTKWWDPASYQKVVNHFRGRIQFAQCGEEGHWHPKLEQVVDLRGKTDTRDFIRLMYHAAGVVCPVTFAMHLAAAVETKAVRSRSRPCVVIAGGREPAHWEAYPQHQFLSTAGMLECCASGGCWKSRCQLVGDGDEKDRLNLCEQPVQVNEQLRIPRCMEMITPTDVIRRIEQYLEGGLHVHPRGARPPRAASHHTSRRTVASVLSCEISERQRVLLEFRHGLGDAVQFGIVLRHLRKYRPAWEVDVKSLRGKHTAFRGECRWSFHEHEISDNRYDQVIDIQWNEQHSPLADVPSTKASRCLIDEFGIDPDPTLFSYRITCSDAAREKTAQYLKSICGDRQLPSERFPVLLLHYQGNTSQAEKDLSHEAALAICDAAIQAGLIPVILDWDRRSPLPNGRTIFCPEPGPDDLWGGFGSGDAEILAALIEQSSVMVGIDSGPLHVAGATTTPTIGIWTGHFPAQYFDTAANVTHFVPRHWGRIGLAADERAAHYFRRNYKFKVYDDLVADVVSHMFPEQPAPKPDPLILCKDFWIRRDNIDQDLVIVRDIFIEDAYRTRTIPKKASRNVVVDIGAHIGCFARLWHENNPQARIVCVEACPDNLPALRRNVGEFAEVIHSACTYEPDAVALLNAVRPHCESTGGSVVVSRSSLERSQHSVNDRQYWPDLRPLPKINLEELMERLGIDRIDVLKLDCEGSEYSILGNTSSLDRIHAVIGEYHGRDRWEAFIRNRFAQWDYRLIADHGESVGLFHLFNRTALTLARSAAVHVKDTPRPEIDSP